MITTTKRQVIDKCDMTDAFDIQPIVRISEPKMRENTITIDTEKVQKTFRPTGESVKTKAKRTITTPVTTETEDVMPAIKTDTKGKTAVLDAKTKMIVLAYAVAAVVLAIIVMSTGLVISLKHQEVANLENQLILKNEVLLAQQSQLDKLNDDTFLAGEAVNNNMVKNDSTTPLVMVDIDDKITYEAKTNGFDKFCDFMSKIFG